MSSQQNSTNIEIGGVAYFLVYISDYLPYVIVYSIGVILGVLGNALIITTILVNKDLHSVTYALIFNLSLADLIISGFVDSFSIIGVFVGKSFFDDRPTLCKSVAAICLIACITSLMNIGLLAINRYIHICHNRLFKKVFTAKWTLLYCMITWLIGFLINIPNISGWGGLGYDEKTLSCLWDRLASQSYSIFFPMSSIVLPCVAILFCYVRIFLYSYHSKSKISIRHMNKHMQSIRLAQGLFASFLLFTICWLPYGLVVMVDFHDVLPRSAIMFTMAVAHLNSALNPVLYATFNTSFKQGYAVLFRKMLCVGEPQNGRTSRITPLRSSLSFITNIKK